MHLMIKTNTGVTDLKKWLLEYIEKNNNVTFGSIWRDACLDSNIKFNSHDGSMFIALGELKNGKYIQETTDLSNTFYSISKQLTRDRIIDELI